MMMVETAAETIPWTAVRLPNPLQTIKSHLCGHLCPLHNAGSFNGPGALTNYTAIFTNRVASAAVANGSMPKNSSLSTNQKNAILCWLMESGE
jgi:hypothetical protein